MPSVGCCSNNSTDNQVPVPWSPSCHHLISWHRCSHLPQTSIAQVRHLFVPLKIREIFQQLTLYSTVTSSLCFCWHSLSLKVIKAFWNKNNTEKETSQLTDLIPCFQFTQLSAHEKGASSAVPGIYFSVAVILHYQTSPPEIRITPTRSLNNCCAKAGRVNIKIRYLI